MIYLRRGSEGREVKTLQEFLGLRVDGKFGPVTESAVRKWQSKNGLVSDGIVGPNTWDCMGIIATDNIDKCYVINDKIVIEDYYLDKNEYFTNPSSFPHYLFIHHTAGSHDPYQQCRIWNNDSRGKVGTEFIIGGKSIFNPNDRFDNTVLSVFPRSAWGWHLGIGRTEMHINSVGIETCNYGFLDNKGRIWTKSATVPDCDIVTLKKPFRGYKHFHKYTDTQINKLKELIIYVGNRDNINIREGLPKWVRERGAGGFEYNYHARMGKVRGLLSHSNVRKDKIDMFPQPEVMDMLVSL